MSEKPESLEKKLYDSFYESFTQDGKENKGEKARFMSKSGKWLRNTTGIATVCIGGMLARKYSKNKRVLRREIIKDLGMVAVPTFFTRHFHHIKNIFEGMYKKGVGKELTIEEIEEIKQSGRNGRYEHIAGFSILGAAIAKEAINRRNFLSKTLLFTSLGLYTIIVKEGYGSLYNSAVDYTIGKKENKDT